MQIKYLDLQANYQSIKPEIDQAIQKVLDSSAYVLGPAVLGFESDYAEYCGAEEVLSFRSLPFEFRSPTAHQSDGGGRATLGLAGSLSSLAH